MTDICHAYVEVEAQLRLDSDPPSVQDSEGWYQGGNVCSGHVSMFTGHVIKEGLFPLRMSPGLASKANEVKTSFGENLELVSSMTHP
ncbi:hypothetical protein TNCV_2096461 [Trichonephila clavipes]|nr:hypothetical protein TNCV_2096461 [Trichonephila clavipes]